MERELGEAGQSESLMRLPSAEHEAGQAEKSPPKSPATVHPHQAVGNWPWWTRQIVKRLSRRPWRMSAEPCQRHHPPPERTAKAPRWIEGPAAWPVLGV